MVLEKDRFSKDFPLRYHELSLQLYSIYMYCMSTVQEDLNICRGL